jgi:hypothetical protein
VAVLVIRVSGRPWPESIAAGRPAEVIRPEFGNDRLPPASGSVKRDGQQMSSVVGVSVGAGAIRVARPHAGNSAERFAPDGFDVQPVPVGEQRPEELAAGTIGAVLEAAPELTATAIAYRSEQHAHALRAAMARRQLTHYELVPEVVAALEFLQAAGDVQGYTTIALYDLGSSGLSVSVVDIAARRVCRSERTSDISGDYLDSLIREQQIAAGRITHPPDQAGLAALDALCRQAKEQLSSSTAVALPSENGLVLISRENFEALITLAVESSARMTRDVITRSERAVQAVVAIGGCAQIPLVSRVLERWTGMPVLVPARPETVVARGVALLARPARATAAAQPPPQAGPPAAGEAETPAPAGLSSPPVARGRRPYVGATGGSPGHRQEPDGPSPRDRELAHGRRRELSAAGIAIGALVVVAALGLGLGWGPQVLQHDSQSSKATPASATTGAPGPAVPQPSTTESSDATNASVVAPPPRWQPSTTDAPSPTPGPNTITVPGLPPIVVPTLPPVVLPGFPPPSQQRQR